MDAVSLAADTLIHKVLVLNTRPTLNRVGLETYRIISRP